jgi:hypothetical protein
LESEGEMEDVNEEQMDNPFIDVEPPAQRKRKRGPITDSDSGEYRPDIVDSQDDARFGNAPDVSVRLLPRFTAVGKVKRKRLPNGTFAAASYSDQNKESQDQDEGYSPVPAAIDRPSLLGHALVTGANEDPSKPAFTTPKRRGRKPKNRPIPPAAPSEAIPTTQESTDDKPRINIQNNNRYSHTEARLELDEGPHLIDSPSRLRARRTDHPTVESSPLSTPGGSGLNYTELDASDSDGPHLHRRSRKRRLGAGDDEYNGGSWIDDDGAKHLGGQDDSDEDSGPIDRRRRRRRPARYED